MGRHPRWKQLVRPLPRRKGRNRAARAAWKDIETDAPSRSGRIGPSRFNFSGRVSAIASRANVPDRIQRGDGARCTLPNGANVSASGAAVAAPAAGAEAASSAVSVGCVQGIAGGAAGIPRAPRAQ